jgi:hypothetical protein
MLLRPCPDCPSKPLKEDLGDKTKKPVVVVVGLTRTPNHGSIKSKQQRREI